MSTSSTCVDRLGCHLANNFRTVQLYIKNHHRVMWSVFHEMVLGPPSQNLCNSPIRMQEAMADQLFWLCYIDIYVNTKDNVTNAWWVGSVEGTQTLSVSSQSHMTLKNMGHIWRVREYLWKKKKDLVSLRDIKWRTNFLYIGVFKNAHMYLTLQ